MSEGVTTKAPRRSKAEQRAESLEQILDAAEYLFSKHGLHGVTLRDVAQRVGSHTTLLNYYFKDKANLFEAVFARRAGVTSSRRMAAMDKSRTTWRTGGSDTELVEWLTGQLGAIR